MGWFYGFKLHLIVNHHGEIVAAKVTTGNVHDTQPVRELATDLTDKLYGDKGYLSKALWQHRVPSKIAEMSQPLKGVIL